MQLILFDIDGTLIESSKIGRDVMAHALERTFGSAGPITNYSLAGKTDLAAIRELTRAAGIPPSTVERAIPNVYRLMAEQGRRVFAGALSPLPGVDKIMEQISTRPDAMLGLLTGNCAATAPLKLAAAGISPELFSVGAYGSDAEDRNQLPALAMERAEAAVGHPFSRHNTVLVGDTPADILCARAAGIRAVSVATGLYSASALLQYAPDDLLTDLSDVDAVISLLLPRRV